MFLRETGNVLNLRGEMSIVATSEGGWLLDHEMSLRVTMAGSEILPRAGMFNVDRPYFAKVLLLIHKKKFNRSITNKARKTAYLNR